MDSFPCTQPCSDVLAGPAPTAVRVATVVAGRSVLVVVEGECDLAAAPALAAVAAAVPASARSLCLDLSGLQFLDWTGLQALLALAPAGVVPVLLDPGRAVRCLLDAAARAGLVPEGLQVVSSAA